MKYKKLSIMIILALILSTFTASTALASTQDNKNQINQISEKYHLKTINAQDVPNGITPVKFSSVEDAEKVLAKLAKTKNITKSIFENYDIRQLSYFIQYLLTQI